MNNNIYKILFAKHIIIKRHKIYLFEPNHDRRRLKTLESKFIELDHPTISGEMFYILAERAFLKYPIKEIKYERP